MIVKQSPDDFRVDELTDVRPEASGPFALYRLEKTGWTTPDALAAVRRRWQIEPVRLSYGGLKDRHACTSQFFTIRHGPARNLTHQRIQVEYVGQLHEPYTSHHIWANRFRIVVRGLNDSELERAKIALRELSQCGVPNYFDDQRFGSVRPGQSFMARALIAGDFEAALKVALTAPYEFDRSEQKKEKTLLERHWADWGTLSKKLPRGHARSLVSYLVHHNVDFRGAVLRLRPELRGLYLSAFQSHLWNRILARWIEDTLPKERLVRVSLRLGEVPMPVQLSPEELERFLSQSIPLPSARTKLAEDDPLWPIIERVLAEEGLQMEEMRVPGVRDLFFSKGERAAHLMPVAMQSRDGDDETRGGRKKLELNFELSRGSYATLILKRLNPGDDS